MDSTSGTVAASVLSSATLSRTTQTGATADALAGRLGGQRASWDAAYAGVPTANTGSGTLYTLEGLGLVLVNFQSRTTDLAADEVAAVVTLSAPREPELPAGEASAADWTVEESLEVARSFLPTDAELAITASADQSGTATPEVGEVSAVAGDDDSPVTCFSDALAATDFGRGAGVVNCRVALLQPTPGTVSFLTLSLARDEPMVDYDPCEGIGPWVDGTDATLAAVSGLVGSIQELDLEAPSAPDDLDAIAEDIRVARDDQAALDTPFPASEAQAALLDALDGYVVAIGLAARGIRETDDALLAEAVAALGDANAQYEDAGELIAVALETCDLAP